MESQQIVQLSQVFDLIDRDSDGLLKQGDIRHLFAAFMIRLSEEDLSKIQRTLTNGQKNQTLDKEAFGSVLESLQKSDIITAVTEGWTHLNQTSTSFIPTDQICDLILKLGLPVTEREVKELVMQYDASRKGGLAFEEFTSMLT